MNALKRPHYIPDKSSIELTPIQIIARICRFYQDLDDEGKITFDLLMNTIFYIK